MKKVFFGESMGEPGKIVVLVQDMIKLSGYQVGFDIEIVYTGLRSGEKLYEELYNEFENPVHTAHEKIFVAHNGAVPLTYSLEQNVHEMIALAQAGQIEATLRKLEAIVNERPQEAVSSQRSANVLHQ